MRNAPSENLAAKPDRLESFGVAGRSWQNVKNIAGIFRGRVGGAVSGAIGILGSWIPDGIDLLSNADVYRENRKQQYGSEWDRYKGTINQNVENPDGVAAVAGTANQILFDTVDLVYRSLGGAVDKGGKAAQLRTI